MTKYRVAKLSGVPHTTLNDLCSGKSHIEEYVNAIEYNYNIEPQKTFDWLKYKKNLFIDYYLPDYNIGIEYQGEQHFVPIERFGGLKDFELRQKRDEIKKRLCEEHGIKMFYLRTKIDISEIIDYINETSSSKKI